ncbi:hypothetical protein KIN20_023222 [Parelaphostrongylus tenuis]|uniref:Uncharacterized protein n=1 Tax=Parelaphostrongylus tenuis TaxID=148309 RepID=A0AAD5QVW8_PARTN|nr:hypothetical protein KIN20_023222 [Parelaphostrongylus tenuis]
MGGYPEVGDPKNKAKKESSSRKALTSLTANMVELNREHWTKDAVDAERAGCTLTCQAIMLAVFETCA